MTCKVRIFGVALILVLSRAFGLPSTPSPTSSQVQRLAALGKLWGMIKLFHPYIAEQNIDWDSALVQTIPKVESANNPEEYRKAIDYLLSFLHDPGTNTISKPASAKSNTAVPSGMAQPFVRWTDDHIAIVVSNDFGQFAGNFSKLDTIKKVLTEASKGKGIVFDLRSHRVEVDESSAWWFGTQFTQALPTILDHELVESATRSRMYSGYPSEEGGSGGYFSAFVIQDGPTLSGTAAKGSGRPMTFLIDSGTPDLSAVFGGLQASGRAIIVLQGPPSDESAFDVYTMDLPEGMKVAIRVDELMNPDGSVGLYPDISVPSSPPGAASSDPALESATTCASSRSSLRNSKGFHARHSAWIGNPFDALRPVGIYAYPQMTFPSKEYFRLLALFRFWNVMQYFHAYQELLDQPWDRTLTDFIPLFEADRNAQDYAITVAKMVARIQDSHGGVQSKVLEEYIGTSRPPLEVRSVEGQTVVTRVLDNPAAKSAITVGDVILAVDGESIDARRQRLGEIFAASTPQALRWKVDRAVLAGPPDKPAQLRVKDAHGNVTDIQVPRLKEPSKDTAQPPIFRVLREGFGYIDLTRLMPAQIDEAFNAVRNTPAIVFDMRGIQMECSTF